MSLISSLLLLSIFFSSVSSSCDHYDAHWKVSYVGLKKYDQHNTPEPPIVKQVAPRKLRIMWGHIIMDRHCVDRYVVHVWDVPERKLSYTIFNNSVTSMRMKVAPCTLYYVQLEMQEDDLSSSPDSRMSYTTTSAITTTWKQELAPLDNRTTTTVVAKDIPPYRPMQKVEPNITIDCSWRGPLYCIVANIVRINSSYSDWYTGAFDPEDHRGVRLEWFGLVHNPTCVKAVHVLISRLVEGAISDHIKNVTKIVTNSPKGAFVESAILALPCHDRLEYTITVELVQSVRINGTVQFFASRSVPLKHLLICTWSEISNEHLYPVAGKIFKSNAECQNIGGDCDALDSIDIATTPATKTPEEQIKQNQTLATNSRRALAPLMTSLLVTCVLVIL